VTVQIARLTSCHNLYFIRLVIPLHQDNPTSGHRRLLFLMNTLYAFLLWAVVVTAVFEPENSELAEMQGKHRCTTPKSSQTTALTHYENFSNHPLLPFPDCSDLGRTTEGLVPPIRRLRPTRKPTKRPTRSKRPTGYPFIGRVSLTGVPTTPDGRDGTGRDIYLPNP
jgi:hypothetical protein